MNNVMNTYFKDNVDRFNGSEIVRDILNTEFYNSKYNVKSVTKFELDNSKWVSDKIKTWSFMFKVSNNFLPLTVTMSIKYFDEYHEPMLLKYSEDWNV